jgi:hypothetical protein
MQLDKPVSGGSHARQRTLTTVAASKSSDVTQRQLDGRKETAPWNCVEQIKRASTARRSSLATRPTSTQAHILAVDSKEAALFPTLGARKDARASETFQCR